MKILLLIIQLIFIKCDCYKSCSSCSDPETSNELYMKCTGCINNYYPIILRDNTINCYSESDYPNHYYFNKLSRLLQECDSSCQGCYGAIDGVNTNCIRCNTDDRYYPIEGNPTFCKKYGVDDDFLSNYYLDEDDYIFKRCYSACATCFRGADSVSHNCKICKDNYFKNGNNCVLECPEDLFSFGYKCVTTCEEEDGYYLDLFSKTCKDTCPSGTTKNNELGLCTIERTSELEDYDCEYIISNYLEEKTKFFISDNSLIVGKDCYIQIYNSLDQYTIHKVAEKYMLSKLFLSADYLDTNIIVIKIDYNQTYNLQPEVNDVSFYLYEKSEIDNEYYKITDLDLITQIDSEDLIYIEKPFIYTENIKLYESKYQVFDIFNARDEIYNNACIPFKSEYNTDLTIDYRREIYFLNLSQYCLNDSTIYYSGFISDSISVQCKANYIENEFIEEKVGDSRFKVFKCRNYIMENLTRLYGFWVILIIFIFNFAILIPFLITCFSNIKNFMRIFERGYNKPTGLKLRWTVLNPPKKNIKVIYKPKEFVLSDDFLEEENDLRYKYNLYKERMNKNKKNENEKLTNIGKKKNKTVYESKNSNNNLSSSNNSQVNNTITDSDNTNRNNNDNDNDNNSFSNDESTSKVEKRKKEEEEKKKERIRIENEKFKEEWSLKEKRQNEKNQYKSYVMPQPEIKNIIKDYSKQQNKILEDKQPNTNLLKLDHIGNVIKSLPTDNLNMKYEPKEYLNQYMLHNYDHLLPVPKSERVSSGSLSSDIRNELLKLQQLREKQMVERIFFKKIIANQKLIKGYNEDFYPFSFDECIIRRKENTTYKIIFWNYLREINLITNIIFDENYLESRYLKIYLLGLSIYSMIFFNILFYNDNYINDFYMHKGKYNFLFQITKSIYSSLCTVVVVKLMSLLVTSKDRLRRIIIKRKYESDKDYIHDYKIILIVLTIKIVIFFLILICFLLFGWFYYCCFSLPYPHSQKYVLVGTIFSFIIYEILSIGVVAMASGLKYSSIKSQSRELYQIMSVVNKFL